MLGLLFCVAALNLVDRQIFGMLIEPIKQEFAVSDTWLGLLTGLAYALFYPGGEPYFYSNPWPFEAAQLLHEALPEGSRWHTEGWQGTILPYDELVGDVNAEAGVDDIRAYFQELSKSAGTLYEAKIVLVGEGAVGKTTLKERLIHNRFGVTGSRDCFFLFFD